MLRRLLIAGLFVSLALTGILQAQEASPSPRFSPRVSSIDLADGTFSARQDLTIWFDVRDVKRSGQKSLEAHARVLAGELGLLMGSSPAVRPLADQKGEGPERAGIELRWAPTDAPLVASEEDEDHSYRLDISEGMAVVTAGYLKGVACGTSTLLQALRYNPFGATAPCMRVEDAPVAAFRSIMIDVARQPHSIDALEDVVRLARMTRMRYVHLHLTDNQHFTFPFEPVTSKLKGNHVYTREEVKGLVTYADVRGVTLIPEIDLPGHSGRLIESGYLKGAEGDRDVADAKYDDELGRLFGDVMDVFDSSPYFHIGGDESGAGNELVPFLTRVQSHVRKRGKRMIVWEGFHGAPTDVLPPAGPDRVIVASWESSYNAPWDLLSAGYELINASWRPTYVVGGDSRVHPGSTAGRSWSPTEIARWSKDRFMHWEPGRAVFEDRGPDDKNLDDGIWDVPKPEWRERMIGGQMCVWEQRETSLLRDLRQRLPVLADRLWGGAQPESETPALLRNVESVNDALFGLVQPVSASVQEISASGEPVALGPASDDFPLFINYGGDSALVTLDSKLPRLTIRYTVQPYKADFGWIDFPRGGAPTVDDPAYESPITVEGGALIAARAFSKDGEPVGGTTWTRVMNWPARAEVTMFDIGRRALNEVPVFDSLPVTERFEWPCIRGPLRHEAVQGQRVEATFVAPGDGKYTIAMKTQSGRASLFLEVGGNLTAVIENTPTSEKPQTTEVTLYEGQELFLRIDHASGLPRPVLIVTVDGPGTGGRKDISAFLKTLR